MSDKVFRRLFGNEVAEAADTITEGIDEYFGTLDNNGYSWLYDIQTGCWTPEPALVESVLTEQTFRKQSQSDRKHIQKLAKLRKMRHKRPRTLRQRMHDRNQSKFMKKYGAKVASFESEDDTERPFPDCRGQANSS